MVHPTHNGRVFVAFSFQMHRSRLAFCDTIMLSRSIATLSPLLTNCGNRARKIDSAIVKSWLSIKARIFLCHRSTNKKPISELCGLFLSRAIIFEGVFNTPNFRAITETLTEQSCWTIDFVLPLWGVEWEVFPGIQLLVHGTLKSCFCTKILVAFF